MCSVTSTAVFVGLDYHAVSVQVCALEKDGRMLLNQSCANDWRAVMGAVRRRCGEAINVQAAIESCCGAASLADELIARGWSVNLAHPGYVSRMKQSPDKTDYTDARMLADLQRVGYLPRVWLAPKEVRELRRLAHYRQGLTKERKNLKLQIGATLREARQKGPGQRQSLDKSLAGMAGEQRGAESQRASHHDPSTAAPGGCLRRTSSARQAARMPNAR